jgi:hypothetical protein
MVHLESCERAARGATSHFCETQRTFVGFWFRVGRASNNEIIVTMRLFETLLVLAWVAHLSDADVLRVRDKNLQSDEHKRRVSLRKRGTVQRSRELGSFWSNLFCKLTSLLNESWVSTCAHSSLF